MFELLRRDYARLAALRQRSGTGFLLDCLLFDNGFQAVCGYRISSALKRAGVPVLPSLVWRWTLWACGVDINPRATFGPGLVISHGVGLVVGGDVTVGEDCLIHHQVTLGAPTVGRIEQNPKVGDRVTLGAGAKVIGAITLGDDAIVGANALVLEDVPPRGRALAPPAEIRSSSADGSSATAPPPPPPAQEPAAAADPAHEETDDD